MFERIGSQLLDGSARQDCTGHTQVHFTSSCAKVSPTCTVYHHYCSTSYAWLQSDDTRHGFVPWSCHPFWYLQRNLAGTAFVRPKCSPQSLSSKACRFSTSLNTPSHWSISSPFYPVIFWSRR